MNDGMGWMLAGWIAAGNGMNADVVWKACFWAVLCIAALLMHIWSVTKEQ